MLLVHLYILFITAMDLLPIFDNQHLEIVITLVQFSLHIPFTFRNTRNLIATRFLNALLNLELSQSTVTEILNQIDVLSMERRLQFGKLSNKQLWKVFCNCGQSSKNGPSGHELHVIIKALISWVLYNIFMLCKL